MPSSETAKTVSEPELALSRKPRRWVRPVVVLVAIVALVLPFVFAHSTDAMLQANGKTIRLEIASTEAAREKGLSGRASMPADHGMLFILSPQGSQCFWMKNMEFPLDMIWADKNKKVVTVVPNLSPKTYPNAYCPRTGAQYVIELNAGEAAKLGIKDGKTLQF